MQGSSDEKRKYKQMKNNYIYKYQSIDKDIHNSDVHPIQLSQLDAHTNRQINQSLVLQMLQAFFQLKISFE